MGIYRGPNIIKEGLVFGYDTGYGVSSNNVATRYNPGEPTTNMYTNSDFSNGESDWTFASWDGNISHTATTVQGPYGNTVSAVKLTVNSASSYSHFHQYNNNKYTSGNAYTQSAWVKGYGTMWGKSHWGGNTQFTMTGDWQYITYTVNATTSSSSNFPYWGGEGLTPGTVFYMTDAQTEANGHATPYVKSGSTTGSRSSTQGLIDLKRNTDIDLSNVSFDNNSQIDFDGTNDFINSSSAIHISGDQSWEAVFHADAAPDSPAGIITNHKYDSSPPSNMGINYVNQNGTYQLGASIGFTDGTRVYDSYRTNNTTISLNTKYHVVMTYDEANNRLIWYINGELDTTHNLSKTPAFSNIQMCSGRWTASYNDYYFNGKIYTARVYNRTLTADQVKQNYNVFKNRFNI